jgi:hypothetical protein
LLLFLTHFLPEFEDLISMGNACLNNDLLDEGSRDRFLTTSSYYVRSLDWKASDLT